MLAEYFNAGLEPHVLRVYVDALRDLPIDQVRQASRALILTSVFMPKVAEIRAAVEAAHAARREAEQRRAQDAARDERRGPFSTFGRMSKARVEAHFGRFIADAPCECVACFDAHVSGPPRFVPDGRSPIANCIRCEDSGWIVLTTDTPPQVARCRCAEGRNPNLCEGTRDHSIEMGRWLHGEDLLTHEQAEAGFHNALRAAVARGRMPKMEKSQ